MNELRPPLVRRLGYHVFGIRLPAECREWVVADIESRSWPLRRGLATGSFMAVIMGFFATIGAITDSDAAPRWSQIVVFGVLATIINSAVSATSWMRARQLRYHTRPRDLIPTR